MRRYPLLFASLLAACPSTSPVSIPCRSSDDCPTGWGCGAGGVCQQGIAGSYGGGCLADAGLTTCDGGPVTYCANLSNDPNDCGGCGVACPAGELCAAGACAASCLTGQTLCGADGGAAYCASLAGDSNNCGGCGRVCAAGERCTAGVCEPSCLAGQSPCGGRDGGAPYCATFGSDSSNCGGCGNACSGGLRCDGTGQCSGSCAAGTTLCGPDGGPFACSDLSSDSLNCGSCGRLCPPGEGCAQGACAPSCLAGETFCNGLCTDTETDPRNCGGCAIVPLGGGPDGGSADAGALDGGSSSDAGTLDGGASDGGASDGGASDGGASDGGSRDAGVSDGGNSSSGIACPPGELCAAGHCTPSCLPTETLCGGLCTNTNTDPLNCGNCNNPCPSGQSCNGAGLCVETCAAGFTPCGGSSGGVDGGPPYCADIASDNANCGACGTTCGGGTSCCPGPGGAGSCVNFATDPANCGGCGGGCSGATPYCIDGLCSTQPSSCEVVGGIRWCYDPNNCGQGCDQVCANLGLPFTISDAAWLAAQDTQAECQAINDAFGVGGTASLASYTYACLQDTYGTHSAPGGLVGPLLCSTVSTCPTAHRTTVDQQGVACGVDSRRSICPCQ
ncbi:MAG: hypothetical protein ACYDCL_14140 [Myxococcales bacterium]